MYYNKINIHVQFDYFYKVLAQNWMCQTMEGNWANHTAWAMRFTFCVTLASNL